MILLDLHFLRLSEIKCGNYREQGLLSASWASAETHVEVFCSLYHLFLLLGGQEGYNSQTPASR